MKCTDDVKKIKYQAQLDDSKKILKTTEININNDYGLILSQII
jgi:hypothetical protein